MILSQVSSRYISFLAFTEKFSLNFLNLGLFFWWKLPIDNPQVLPWKLFVTKEMCSHYECLKYVLSLLLIICFDILKMFKFLIFVYLKSSIFWYIKKVLFFTYLIWQIDIWIRYNFFQYYWLVQATIHLTVLLHERGESDNNCWN